MSSPQNPAIHTPTTTKGSLLHQHGGELLPVQVPALVAVQPLEGALKLLHRTVALPNRALAHPQGLCQVRHPLHRQEQVRLVHPAVTILVDAAEGLPQGGGLLRLLRNVLHLRPAHLGHHDRGQAERVEHQQLARLDVAREGGQEGQGPALRGDEVANEAGVRVRGLELANLLALRLEPGPVRPWDGAGKVGLPVGKHGLVQWRCKAA
mmetsp:Transcript_4552/g.15948  ORF Transcript_4552/g.15948 Transcript_4552/m.15948 type:complete len:208 (+) Transcript_4552:65-688(+)